LLVEPGDPRGLFLGDYMGLETIQGADVITFFSSTLSDGADVHAIRVYPFVTICGRAALGHPARPVTDRSRPAGRGGSH